MTVDLQQVPNGSHQPEFQCSIHRPGSGCSLGASAQFRQGIGTAWGAALLDVPGTLGAPGWGFPWSLEDQRVQPYYGGNPHGYPEIGISDITEIDLVTSKITPG